MSAPDETNANPDEPPAEQASPSEAETPAGETPPSTPSEPEDPAAVVAWCLENPEDDDALPRLNSLHDTLQRPELANDVVRAAAVIVNALIQQPSPGPVAQAHMIILLGQLLRLEKQRDAVDQVFLAWLKHPSTFGTSRVTPPEFQKAEFVQRVADLIGWGTLDVVRDGEAMGRFFSWVNTWVPKQKRDVRRTVEMLRRVFPAPELWKRVKLF